MATSLAGSHTLFGPIVSCPGELSDHQGVDACFTMETSLSRSGTFRAPPLIEKTPGYQNSENFLINEELISLSKISHREMEEEYRKNKEVFDMS